MWESLNLDFSGVPFSICSFLREDDDGLTLVETGPSSCLAALERELADRGHHLKDVRRVFLTHIHLDHAGAAGHLAQSGATIFCHPRAYRHLLEPSRLIDGAKAVYGVEQFNTLWGDVLPVPQTQLQTVEDGQRVHGLQAWDTPGHARHHAVWQAGDVLFAGDLAGVRKPGGTWTGVTAAPSQFDLDAYVQSLDRVLALSSNRLFLTHGGEVPDPVVHLNAYKELLKEETDFLTAGRPSLATYTAWARRRAGDEADWLASVNPPFLNFAGIGLWSDRRSRG